VRCLVLVYAWSVVVLADDEARLRYNSITHSLIYAGRKVHQLKFCLNCVGTCNAEDANGSHCDTMEPFFVKRTRYSGRTGDC
jgi:hypothetical protein